MLCERLGLPIRFHSFLGLQRFIMSTSATSAVARKTAARSGCPCFSESFDSTILCDGEALPRFSRSSVEQTTRGLLIRRGICRSQGRHAGHGDQSMPTSCARNTGRSSKQSGGSVSAYLRITRRLYTTAPARIDPPIAGAKGISRHSCDHGVSPMAIPKAGPEFEA